jgi:hypothetical protein
VGRRLPAARRPPRPDSAARFSTDSLMKKLVTRPGFSVRTRRRAASSPASIAAAARCRAGAPPGGGGRRQSARRRASPRPLRPSWWQLRLPTVRINNNPFLSLSGITRIRSTSARQRTSRRIAATSRAFARCPRRSGWSPGQQGSEFATSSHSERNSFRSSPKLMEARYAIRGR